MVASARAKLKQHLMDAEGFVPHAYEDTAGWLTIGFGRLIDKRLGGGISKLEAEYLLGNDIDRVIKELRAAFPWFETLNQVRQAALAELCFNLGLGNETHGLRSFINSLPALKNGDYARAAQGFRQSQWARDVGPRRSARVVAMLETGRWPAVPTTQNV